MSDAIRSIIRDGVRGPCPLQLKPKLASTSITALGYDSDGSPLTTGPSSAAASTPGDEVMSDEEVFELTFPERNQSYLNYHQTTFPKSVKATLEEVYDPESEAVYGTVDNHVLAEDIIRKNSLNDHLFAAVCPWNFNETSMFLYGQQASPRFLASLLANNPQYRVFEQAARMFPATINDHKLANIGNTEFKTLVPCEGESAEGYVLFSTSIRERTLLKVNRGDAFEQFEGHATIYVDGREVTLPVMTSKCTPKWMERVELA